MVVENKRNNLSPIIVCKTLLSSVSVRQFLTFHLGYALFGPVSTMAVGMIFYSILPEDMPQEELKELGGSFLLG